MQVDIEARIAIIIVGLLAGGGIVSLGMALLMHGHA